MKRTFLLWVLAGLSLTVDSSSLDTIDRLVEHRKYYDAALQVQALERENANSEGEKFRFNKTKGDIDFKRLKYNAAMQAGKKR